MRMAGLLVVVVVGAVGSVWLGGRLFAKHETPAAEAPPAVEIQPDLEAFRQALDFLELEDDVREDKRP